MSIHFCPDSIVSLFEDEASRPEGRKKAVEWMKSIIATVAEGDVLMIPDGETGELIAFTKTSAGVA